MYTIMKKVPDAATEGSGQWPGATYSHTAKAIEGFPLVNLFQSFLGSVQLGTVVAKAGMLL